MKRHLQLFYSVTIILISSFALPGCISTGENPDFKPPVFPPPPEKARFIWERTLRASSDVREISAADRFQIFATGVSGRAYGLAKPYGLAAYKGRIYVSDTVQRSVMLFDFPNKDFKPIGIDGPGQLAKPIGLTVDKNNGDLYVADNSGKRVVVFDGDGNYLRAIGGSEILRRPSDVALSNDSTRLYVIDTGGVDSREHHMYIFDPQTGELLDTIGERGKEEGDFNLAVQLSVAPDGTVYVVDAGNFRVQAFNEDGSFKKSFGGIGRYSGQFSRPKGIAIDKEGNIYVVDTAFGNFQIFNPQGELLLFVGNRGRAGGPAQYMLPAGIAIDLDGRVYMADQYFKKIDVYRPADLDEDQGYIGKKYLQELEKKSK